MDKYPCPICGTPCESSAALPQVGPIKLSYRCPDCGAMRKNLATGEIRHIDSRPIVHIKAIPQGDGSHVMVDVLTGKATGLPFEYPGDNLKLVEPISRYDCDLLDSGIQWSPSRLSG